MHSSTAQPDATGPLPAGRPRDGKIDDALLVAAADLLREQGYGAFSVGALAERAGTTRPAVYRRWPLRQDLAIAALSRQLESAPTPDSGCTRCDLVAAIEAFGLAFQRSLPPRVLAPLIADCAADPELFQRAMAALFLPLCQGAESVLDRAVARGDLRADIDRQLVLDLLASMVHYRSLYGQTPITLTLVEDLVDTLLQGIAVDYPRLREVSRRPGHASQHDEPAAADAQPPLPYPGARG